MKKIEKDTTVICRELGIKLVHFNSNKLAEINNANDCTTIALSRLLNISWEEAITIQHNKVLETGLAFNSTSNIKEILKEYDYEEIKISPCCSIASFIINNRKGRYFISSHTHAIACINSTIYDKDFCYYDDFIVSRKLKIFKKR